MRFNDCNKCVPVNKAKENWDAIDSNRHIVRCCCSLGCMCFHLVNGRQQEKVVKSVIRKDVIVPH